MSADPWFYQWNYDILQLLFRLVPHSKATDDFCETLLFNPLLSTWIFAFSFYWMWTQEHEQKAKRRRYLIISVIAFGFACLVTIVLRPWVHWAAPVLRKDFQPLFPPSLWGNGVANCFPSHSTLTYFTIAAGFWPIHRRLSLLLMTAALLLISFPRVYEGGHYPIDVVFSCFLGGAALLIFWSWPLLGKLPEFSGGRSKSLLEVLFFLWVFELGEAFRGLEMLAASLLRKFSS